MYQKIYSSFLIFLCSLFLSTQASAQSKTVIAKIDKADKFFLINDFTNALSIYLELDKTEPKDALTNYRIGICYFNLSQKEKALPYFEYALSHKNENVPEKVYQYTGQLYHLSYRFSEAITLFTAYKKALEKTKVKTAEIDRQIETSRNAGLLLADTLDVFIQNVGAPINTTATEYGPVISADESMLIYTTLKPFTTTKKTTSSTTSTEQEDISIAYRKDIGIYSTPVSIGLNTKTNIGSVGLSPDGQHLLIYMGGQTNNGDIYSCALQGDKWTNPVKLSSKINSAFQESSASLTPDQKTLYFASNRPGGLGGSDIYMVHKNNNGEWSEPANMGPAINTPYDEDSPFIHPDGKTLYFSSTGHNTMGGSDIFKASFTGKTWSVPANMGFPINTVFDDNYFVLSADGKKGYYSSNRPGGAGGGDIYFLGIPEEQGVIPLTMMKGRIITGDKQVPTKIKIIDKENSEVIKNVYDPNIKTGNYLIIFPPGKSYDMIIEAEGYMPYLVNICVPNQNYFYELYQEIHMKSIVQAGKQIGQEISVKNVFYDIEKDSTLFDPAKFGSNNLDLYDLMDNVIAASDTAALDYLLNMMYNEKTVDLSSVPAEPLTGTYYYDDAQGKLQPVVINGDTIYSLPAFKITGDQITKPDVIAEIKQPITKETVIEPNKTYIIYFDTDKTDLKTDAMPELEKVYGYLKKNASYGIKIAGYADADGSDERNRLISDNRAKAVAKYLSSKGIVAGRITAKGFGQVPEASKNESEQDKKMHRKAEIMMVELKN